MTKLEQCRAELEEATIRGKRFLDEGNMPAAAIVAEEIRTKRLQLDRELEAHRADESAARNLPAPPMASSGGGWREIRMAMLEKRAITANGAGINTVPDVISALVDGGKLRSKVSVFLGKNSTSVVPVFAPTLALPVGTAPGATGTASDTTAVLTGKNLVLKPWYNTLAVGMDALISTAIEAALPGILAKNFAGAIDKGVLVGAGSGSDMLGVFVADAGGVPTGSDIACAAAGTPKWVDLAKLALTVNGLGTDPLTTAIVMHPNIMAPLLSESTTGVDPHKEEYLVKGTILGIPVILSSYCPTTLTAGSYVVVGGDFAHYGLAIAQELTIDPIKTIGSDNVTFQAFMYMQGSPLIGGSFRRLKTV